MAFTSSVIKLNHFPNMRLTDLITPEAVLPSLRVNSKKHILQELSERAARISGLTPREIFDSLLQRERLGPTGPGDGLALPHREPAEWKDIFGLFARLEKPIDFEAIHGG